MIHHVFIIDANDDIVVKKRTVDEALKLTVEEKKVREFALRVKEAQDIIFDVGETRDSNKLAGGPLGRGVVVLCAQQLDQDDVLRDRLKEVAERFRQVISYDVDYDDFLAKAVDYIIINLKVSVIGYGGVGKTTFLKLLRGEPPRKEYDPTVALEIESVLIGTYKVSTWDFAGQQRFHKLWELYLRGSNAVLLVTDSTLANVLDTKEILDWVLSHRDLEIPILAIANKQDLPGALSPELVQRVLGVKTRGMVATELANRDKALSILTELLQPRF
jgi:small GTP-binding protein